MKRKVHVNDELSPNSIFLVGKVTGNEVVFLRDPVFVHVLDGTLQSIFGTSSEVFGDLKKLAGIEYSDCLVQNLSPFCC